MQRWTCCAGSRGEPPRDRLRAGNKWVSTGYLFVTEFGDPCDPRNALRALQGAAQAVGLPQVGLHTIRHTAATVMLENGVQMKVVSAILGHAGIAITADINSHVRPDVARGALDGLSEALGKQTGGR